MSDEVVEGLCRAMVYCAAYTARPNDLPRIKREDAENAVRHFETLNNP